MGWMIVAIWLLLAVVLVLLGKLCNSGIIAGIGAVMVLMIALVSDVAW